MSPENQQRSRPDLSAILDQKQFAQAFGGEQKPHPVHKESVVKGDGFTMTEAITSHSDEGHLTRHGLRGNTV